MIKLKSIFLKFLCGVSISFIFYGCANISAPTGGPKDIVSPKIVEYKPENNSINFKGNVIYLKTSEKLQDIDDPEQILVNPALKNPLEIKIKNKKNVEIKIKEALKENTTYTINFRNTIKDLTEGNIAEEIQYNFSTGNFIDSNRISGSTIDLFKNIIREKVIIGIYETSDTFNIKKTKPLYFTKIGKDGKYKINNIKTGVYKVFAFNDFNNTLLYDNEEKIIDFYDTVNIVGNLKLDLKLSKIKSDSVKILSGKENNKNEYTINLNSGVKNLIVKDSEMFWKKRVTTNGKSIVIFNNNKIYNDSITIIIEGVDSLEQKFNLTSKIIFNSTEKTSNKKQVVKKYPMVKISKPLDNKLKSGKQEIVYSFNTPIKKFLLENIFIKYDSLGDYKNEEIIIKWNEDSTELKISTNIKFKDSIIVSNIKPLFIDIFNDTIQKIRNKYILKKENEEGKISGTVTTSHKDIILQLTDEKGQVIEQQTTSTLFEFDHISPGKYNLRAIVDSNGNNKWDAGNIKKMKKAEDIVFYENVINIKADWEINDIIFKF